MLFTNPRTWAQSAVGTWWRFGFIALANAGFIATAVYVAAESGLRAGLSAALMPLVFQLCLLYALRRMYRQATGAEIEKNAT